MLIILSNLHQFATGLASLPCVNHIVNFNNSSAFDQLQIQFKSLSAKLNMCELVYKMKYMFT